ncbi:hypothetical protein DPMN_114970 [Dreissena polymorpha]|uniref:Uncharacterized protein n=1 Tax=Dreissena polymorpha TaxID=45954 RepID=A0A9D4KKD4_DREPO|nr:hypothetical protein DPMN_114970 [Dreissena polymorpha]
MSYSPFSTGFNAVSNNVCAFISMRQTEPACFNAQFDEATQSCALFNGFEHVKNLVMLTKQLL